MELTASYDVCNHLHILLLQIKLTVIDNLQTGPYRIDREATRIDLQDKRAVIPRGCEGHAVRVTECPEGSEREVTDSLVVRRYHVVWVAALTEEHMELYRLTVVLQH